MSNQSPPKWAPNAVPTEYGWVNPKTGELLVSKKGLTDVVSGYGRNTRPKSVPVTTADQPSSIEVTLNIETPDTLVETTFVELEVEPMNPETTEPEVQRRRPGRPKKRV